MWDATCADTYAPSYRNLAVCAAGDVAARVESLKEEKYIDLLHNYNFVPVAVETSGVFGPRTLSFVRDLGRRLRRQTGEVRSTAYLIQRLSVAVQQGNAISVLGACCSQG